MAGYNAFKAKVSPEVRKKSVELTQKIDAAAVKLNATNLEVLKFNARQATPGKLDENTRKFSEDSRKFNSAFAKATQDVSNAISELNDANQKIVDYKPAPALRGSAEAAEQDRERADRKENAENAAFKVLVMSDRRVALTDEYNKKVHALNEQIAKTNAEIAKDVAKDNSKVGLLNAASKAAAEEFNRAIEEKNRFEKDTGTAMTAKFASVKSAYGNLEKLDQERIGFENESKNLNATADASRNSWNEQIKKDTEKMLKDAESKIKEEAGKKNCGKGVAVTWSELEGFEMKEYSGHGLPSTDDRKAMDSQLQKAKDDGQYCTKPFLKRSDTVPVSPSIPLDVNPEEVFKDNETTIDPQKLGSFLKKVETELELNKSVKPGCQREVESISIQTSANSKRNKGAWADRPWDFENLSRERAENMEKTLGDFLTKKAKEGKLSFINHSTPHELTDIDYLGKNLNGTSGPCAYKLEPLLDKNKQPRGVNRIVLDTDKPEAEFEKAKFLKINVTLSPQPKECGGASGEENKDVSYLASKCFYPDMKCKE